MEVSRFDIRSTRDAKNGKNMEKHTLGLEHVHLMVQESILTKIVGIVLNA